ncbi:transcriptional regulator, TetR family [Klenkia soli]|uniref:Transcriptional regulator, TetR family n=1 Tax=Klenkia soli TaxID=1052260 RepID=A0A1H0DXV5_9ACTN|nr:TetR/AcrR family transcriptional regulator [Klenkia soli]SDN74831.1 transcriptional regulator, TetR family [Klenkia soli]
MRSVPYGTAKEALLQAAVTVAATRGLRGLTYRSVAAEAGVTHGSVRYHFGSWDVLVEEALQHCVTRSLAEIHLGSPDPGFGSLASGIVEMVTLHPEAQAFQFELYLEGRRRPGIAAVMERVNARYRAAVSQELLRNGLDDPDLAELVFLTLDALVLHQTAFGGAERTGRAVTALRRLLRRYAGCPAGSPA